MQRLAILIALSLLPASLSAAEPEKSGPPVAKEKFQLFLLIGQSNMAGRGKPAEEDKKAHPRVWSLNKEGAWVPALAPIHFDKPNVAGVGPGVPFGKQMAEKLPDAHIGLIPCAFGGTSIDQWSKTGKLRTEALARTRRALQDGTLKGILWHQGESDAKKPDVYLDKLVALVGELRTELAAPELPFIAGEIGRWYKDDGSKQINDALNMLPGKVSRTACVSAEGLKNFDSAHFDTPGQHELGKRYAEAYFKLTQSPK